DQATLQSFNQNISKENVTAAEPNITTGTDSIKGKDTSGQVQKVWVKQGEMIHPKEITVGVTDEIHYQVLSGLKEGDEVVVAMTSQGAVKTTKATATKSPFMPQRPGSNRKTTK
ncbi:MAG TPA: hypothetical protein DCL77_04720, partial [Prolixibacteraceae bacterium]|nr:hypothetical protein [Prolixibacteraceae bacterium]